MLNAIAVSLIGYLLASGACTVGNSIQTKAAAQGLAGCPGIPLIPGAPNEVLGPGARSRCSPASASGVLLNRTRFGFDLRATGASATAAVASGIDVSRMVVISMLLSGGVAGLIGMPLLFGDAHTYGTTFQAGLGFAGIAVALLGRNHPVGIAFGALLFAFLVEQSSLLEINAGISNDIVAITQGVLVLSVVVAYELVRRYRGPARAARRSPSSSPRRATTEVPA